VAARSVVVLDYDTADTRATASALEAAGATVTITHERAAAMDADGLVVSGTAPFAPTMHHLAAVRGAELMERRLAGGRAVLGLGVGMHILFERSFPDAAEGLGEWPGELTLHEHEGWSSVDAAPASPLFAGIENEKFHFDHTIAAFEWKLDVIPPFSNARLSWAEAGGRILAAVENGPLAAIQFRPQDSGEAGIHLLRNWLSTLSNSPL
jgi:glutamine amidotransferase